MIDEPNSHNHHQQQQREELEADSGLPPELEALAARLTADGAFWQSRLPDPEQVAERVRAIPEGRASFQPATSEGNIFMFDDSDSAPQSSRPVYPQRSRPSSFWQRLGSLAAVAVVVALVGSAAVVFYAHSHAGGGSPGSSSTHTTSTSTSSAAAFQISSVAMSVKPTSIAGMACGTTTTVTYTAVFQVTSGSPGGKVQFNYTVNNGRGETPASITFSSGQASKTYSFTWTGALPADHTYPGLGGVQVTSPNQLTSKLVVPSGQCAPVTAPNCGSNFSSPISQSYQSTLKTDYGTVPLPPLSRTVPNDAAGGVRGYDICSAGTAASITAYMEQNLPTYGWTLVSKSGGMESWKSSSGTINWSVSNPLEWNINWRLAQG